MLKNFIAGQLLTLLFISGIFNTAGAQTGATTTQQYMLSAQQHIKSLWQAQKAALPLAIHNNERLLAVVNFTVDASGKIFDASISKSCGYPQLDQACLDAVAAASPLPPLPDSLKGHQNIAIDMVFDYNILAKSGTPKTAGALPDNAQQCFALGMQYKDAGQIEQARAALQQAVKLGNGSGIATDAQTVLDTAIPRYPVKLEAEQSNAQGYNFMHEGSFEAAKQAFNDAIKICPQFEWPYNNLASLCLKQGDPKQAKDYAKKALAINPSFVHAWCMLADAQIEEGDCNAAQVSINHALKCNPNDQAARMGNSLIKLKLVEQQLEKQVPARQPGSGTDQI